MPLRGIRGATCLTADDADEMSEAVVELLSVMIERNGLTHDDLVSVIFTATPDIHCGFPAAAGRAIGLVDVPLLCAQEIDVTGAMPLVVRVLMHAELDRALTEVSHVYLRGAEALRVDLAQ
ncbi:MAG: chorismate mutase [Candidatus Nanopelagicales bacterium]